VRQTLTSPYADKELIRRPDGSWIYPYFQENPNPAERDKEATNRGLMKCMVDRVPIGALMQSKPAPGVEYEVLGLAIVAEWQDGYFILEGFSDQGDLKIAAGATDAPHDRARVAAAMASDDFDVGAVTDHRERQIAQVVRRRGQAKFRAALIDIYGGKCAITGCDAVEALEAAHISPYRGEETNHTQNGLLLRADLHSLFDLGLISIDPSTMKVVLAVQLKDSSYAALAGTRISAPTDPSLTVSVEALKQHMTWTGIEQVHEA
jgi:putative restriction endonuclease